jgi:hypothetical protein
MSSITLPPDLENWANTQVAQGASPSVEALVTSAMDARKREADWLDMMVKDALESVNRDGWVDGEVVLAEMDKWIAELDQEIAELDLIKAQRTTA